MRRDYHISDRLHSWGMLLWTALGLMLLILLLGVSEVYGSVDDPAGQQIGVVESEAVGSEDALDDAEEAETVTMTIELEEGGAIDLQTSMREVTIGTWDGDEIPVIVKKEARPFVNEMGRPVAPMDIHVTRHGKDVRIRTLTSSGIDPADFGISFRIVLPEGMNMRNSYVKDRYSLTKLTSVLMRALHHEAIRWIAR